MVDLEEIAACLDLDATVGFGGSARHLGEVLIHRDNNDEAVRDVSIVEVVMEQTAVVVGEVLERARCEAIDAAAAECSDASIARSILSLRASCHQALLRPSLSLLNTKPARERTGWIVGFIIMAQGVAKPRRLQRRGASLAAPSSGISVECSAASSFSLLAPEPRPRHISLIYKGVSRITLGMDCLALVSAVGDTCSPQTTMDLLPGATVIRSCPRDKHWCWLHPPQFRRYLGERDRRAVDELVDGRLPLFRV